MTVSSTTTKVSYSGDGSTAVFAYTFKIFDADELVVITRVDATGVETTETLNTAYIVDGVENANGGNVTFKYNTGNPADPNYSVTDFRPQTGETVVIKRVVGLTQLTDYTPNDPFPAQVHEESLDKLTFMNQQQQEEIDRSFKFAETDAGTASIPVASERASKYLGFDASGDVIAVDGTTNATPISTFGATLVDDADASAARTTLGLGSLSVLSTVATASIDDNAITNVKMADNSVGSAEIIDNSVTAAELNISGNGTAGQYVVSDGDGSFSYESLDTPTIQVITSTGTWTRPTDCKKVRVTVVGGGGGGSGAQDSDSAAGTGGGASIKYVDVTSISSVSVTIGAGGSGGAYNTDGSDGGTSSFGTHCSATGGDGGRNDALTREVYPGEGSDGDINLKGGHAAVSNNIGSLGVTMGGSSIVGSGGTPRIRTSTVNVVRTDPSLGAGGSGSTSRNGYQLGGGDGGSGVVIIEEYYEL